MIVHNAAISSLLIASILITACSSETTKEQSVDSLVAEMTQRIQATTDLEKRDDLKPRFNQPKTISCLNGDFEVSDKLPAQLQHGLFATPATYPVMARFANATKFDDSEKDLRGMSIKVSGIKGETLWGEQGIQDFIFNSHPALFVATPEEFLAFMRARQKGSTWSLVKFFLSPFDPHIKALSTVLKARSKHKSPADIRYYSTVPSALDSRIQPSGELPEDTQAIKYALTPCSNYKTDQPVDKGENQLRSALRQHLNRAPVCYSLEVQLQTDPEAMPLEDASVIWDEKYSPFVPVATLTFNQQKFEDEASLNACERTSFNPWQSLPAHTPLGRMNAVRKAVYAAGASHRTDH